MSKMILVKVPKRVKVGGIDYKVRNGKRINKELTAEGFRGTHSSLLRELDITNDQAPQENSNTILHEFIHAVDHVYCSADLSEAQCKGMANGLHQIIEQLGIRFVL